MNITDFLAASQNLPFLVAGAIVVVLLGLAIISTLLGLSHEIFHFGADLSLDANHNGIPDHLEISHFNVITWVNPGRVPSTILLILLCGIYSIAGYSIQWAALNVADHLVSALITGPIVLVFALMATRWMSNAIAPVMPKDESNAIALETLVGNAGVVTAGPISHVDFGVARFSDSYGTDHSLIVSGQGEEVIENGSAVVLIGPHPEREIAFVVRKI